MMTQALRTFRDYTAITLGTFFLSLGIGVFLIEARIVPGGVSGLAVSVNYLTNGWISVGLVIWLINLPLYFWGLKVLGRQFGIRTFYGFTLNSIFIDLLRGNIPGFSFIRVQEMVALKDMLANDFLIFVATGAILIGLGLGIVFKFRGTTGGSDIIAAIAQKKLGLKPGHVFMLTDFMVICIGGLVIHLKGISPDKPALTLTLYSFILLFGSARLVDIIIDGFNYANSAVIISFKYEEISRAIMDKLSRGATVLHGRGLYTNMEREVLYTVVLRKEVTLLTEIVKEIDPDAFIIVTQVHEVLGRGFRPRM
ncbi:MAG: YitT family protein [Desulfobacteraceae bacterium]|nr:MAG: YitT family protein [Desulfobacteraceae bacterium]